MTSESKDKTIKVELDKVFELNRCEVINDIRKAYENQSTDSLSYEQIMNTVNEIESSISSQLETNQNKINKTKIKTKRSPTIYNEFVKNMIKQVKEMHPDTNKNELMRECGRIWTSLTSDEKFDKNDLEKVRNIKLADIKDFPSFTKEEKKPEKKPSTKESARETKASTKGKK